MVRNVEPLQQPTYRTTMAWRARLRILRWETLKACKQATRIIAVSRYVKDLLCESGVPGGKIDVIYHGVGPDRAGESMPAPCAGVRVPFLFSAGSLVPYRGFEDILRAVATIKEDGRRAPVVVLAGSGSRLARGYERELRALANDLGVQESIVWAGQLNRAEMNWCARAAVAVIQASRAESFSLFQVEALQAGAVVVSTKQAPMPEILGSSAMYYEGGDAADLARVIRRVLAMTPSERRTRSEAAKVHGGKYSPDRDANEILNTIEVAYRERRSEG